MLPPEAAQAKMREMLEFFPKAAYGTSVEGW